jgi:transposase-like zinc-binding protein
MKPHRLELADVFRTHQHDFLARWNSVLSRQQRKALRDIRDCRTAVLGGHLYECDRCGHRVKVFNSCRNRNCPKCQATARARWLAQREAELLPVPYFHVTFTLPQHVYFARVLPSTVGARFLHARSRCSILRKVSFRAAYGSISRKKPFNTQRLVPAPFNEFYPKRSGPAITPYHAMFSAGALPIESSLETPPACG